MRKVTQPAVIYCDDRLYLVKPEIWQRLWEMLKGLPQDDWAEAGRAFLVAEGIIKERVNA